MRFEEVKKRLKHKTVGIAGAGGLGSNCAVALVRSGLGHLVIADYDVVSESNLNRQYYFRDQIGMKKVDALKENLMRINPDLLMEVHDLRITSENVVTLFSACDVIVEAFDLAEMKEMLITAAALDLAHIPLVGGVGLAGYGKLEALRVRRWDNLILCGDGISEVSEVQPPLAPRVGIVSHMQADVVLAILLNEE